MQRLVAGLCQLMDYVALTCPACAAQLDPARLFGGVHVRSACLHPRQPTLAIVRSPLRHKAICCWMFSCIAQVTTCCYGVRVIH